MQKLRVLSSFTLLLTLTAPYASAEPSLRTPSDVIVAVTGLVMIELDYSLGEVPATFHGTIDPRAGFTQTVETVIGPCGTAEVKVSTLTRFNPFGQPPQGVALITDQCQEGNTVLSRATLSPIGFVLFGDPPDLVPALIVVLTSQLLDLSTLTIFDSRRHFLAFFPYNLVYGP